MYYDHHIRVWARLKQAKRFRNRAYRLNVTRMTQLNQLKARNDLTTYSWLKDLWRSELTYGRAS